MLPHISLQEEIQPDQSVIALLDPGSSLPGLKLSTTETVYLEDKLRDKKTFVYLNHYYKITFAVALEKNEEGNLAREKLRRSMGQCLDHLREDKAGSVVIANFSSDVLAGIAALEGLVLSAYRFDKYLTGSDKPVYRLPEIGIADQNLKKEELEWHKNLLEATCIARDLVNEPLSYLTARRMADEFIRYSPGPQLKIEVMNRKKIEALKMGGLLAVNRGSVDPPVLSVLEYKSPGAVNKKPYLLVGKGLVYDTGGMSLKPTKNSMDQMKSDMAGAAAVYGAMHAIAKSQLPVHVIALIPATDNRPGGNAYVPGDIITMYNGKTVEILNTDAEGRLVLADALSYGERYKPELVVSVATLTGSAQIAIGKYGMVGMGNVAENIMAKIQAAGNQVHERVVAFPFWEEYGEEMKSQIADYKNIGEREGGAVSAGKFLEFFTGFPLVHLDISGMALLTARDGYRLTGGTGVGVRLLGTFIRAIAQEKKSL